jgi:hypothetical protein
MTPTKIAVVLIRDGPFSGKIAIIAEIIDHNRVNEDLGIQMMFDAECAPRQLLTVLQLVSLASPSATRTSSSHL